MIQSKSVIAFAQEATNASARYASIAYWADLKGFHGFKSWCMCLSRSKRDDVKALATYVAEFMGEDVPPLSMVGIGVEDQPIAKFLDEILAIEIGLANALNALAVEALSDTGRDYFFPAYIDGLVRSSIDGVMDIRRRVTQAKNASEPTDDVLADMFFSETLAELQA